MAQFIDGEAEGEEEYGHENDEDDNDEGAIEGLFATGPTKRDRDGLHLAAGAKRRLEQEREEEAEMEAAAERYNQLGTAYMNSRDDRSTVEGEMAEAARAQRAARAAEEARIRAAVRGMDTRVHAKSLDVAAQIHAEPWFDLAQSRSTQLRLLRRRRRRQQRPRSSRRYGICLTMSRAPATRRRLPLPKGPPLQPRLRRLRRARR